MHDIGEEATDLLLRRLNGNEQPDSFSRQVAPELIVRTSS
jgi:DNA-binding LacI/PurR family transcriptional regulator